MRPWNDRGLPILVRYAHEMNGSWYPWGQQPDPSAPSYPGDEYVDWVGLTLSYFGAAPPWERNVAPEVEIKTAWAAQVFAPEIPEELPGLDLVMWFEYAEQEAAVPDEAAGLRDESATDRVEAVEEIDAASLDGLTGSYARGPGMAESERDRSRAERTGETMTLAFVDVDDLEGTNDRDGHAAGETSSSAHSWG